MIAAALVLSLALQAAAPVPPPQAATAEKPKAAEEATLAQKLLAVKRIYVDSFGEDTISKQIQAMVISSLAETKRFIITENKDKADAILKGTALEKTSQEAHSFSEGAAAKTAGGGFTVADGTGGGGFHAAGVAAEDSHSSTETVNDARVAVRLVSNDGDVIWTTKQESKGAKYKGASADVADKVAKQLMRDLEKLEKPAAGK